MFRIIRFCMAGVKAGLIGMSAGVAGQIYINEFTAVTPELRQAAIVFSELDQLSFAVLFISILILIKFCLAVEVKNYFRRKNDKDKVYDPGFLVKRK